jgi:hypothetical protein
LATVPLTCTVPVAVWARAAPAPQASTRLAAATDRMIGYRMIVLLSPDDQTGSMVMEMTLE